MLHCITPTDGRCGRVCRHPPLTKHRNKNSINVKLTKTGTGCLRCTPPCSGVRRQAMMGVPLQAITHGARASIRPTAEPEPERFADYNFVRGAPFCCRSGFLQNLSKGRCGYPTKREFTRPIFCPHRPFFFDIHGGSWRSTTLGNM